MGPLELVCGAPDRVRGQPVRILVDNSGSVAIWKKGYSTSCELSSVLVKTLHEVSAALECQVDIVKVTRCSDVGSQMADALSKAEFVKFLDLSRGTKETMTDCKAELPKALLDWVTQPHEDWNLARSILEEMSGYTKVLGY